MAKPAPKPPKRPPPIDVGDDDDDDQDPAKAAAVQAAGEAFDRKYQQEQRAAAADKQAIRKILRAGRGASVTLDLGPDVVAELARRAGEDGCTLEEYIREALVDLVEPPTLAEVLGRSLRGLQ